MKFLAFGLVVLAYLQSFAATDLQLQVTALHEIRMMLIDNRGVLGDWNENQLNPCVYSYIMCDQDNNVYAITLSKAGLSGVMSPSIGKLTSLRQLAFDGNLINGEIPQEIGNLPKLMILQLGNNILNGSIPESFGNLSELQIMDLSQNRLSGNIPISLLKLPSLHDINLGGNRLTGKIPNVFGRLQGLQNLDLDRNGLSGEIPKSLSSLTFLKDIDLSYNSLSGGIPLQLFQVAKYNFVGNHLNCSQNSTPCEGSNGHKTKRWIIFIATAVPLVVAFLSFMFCFRWIRRHRKVQLSLWDISKVNERQDEELVWGIEGKKSGFTLFSLSQLLEATSNFSDENKLGQGGFGPVYKGQFPDGLEVAVKRLASHSGQGFTEFKNEIQLIANLQHRNLVRLLGCCSQGEDKMLVYEYLPNKSLDFFIFDEARKALLNWNKRLTIIEGIAQGLLYLHKHSRLRVIHRDVKASNILLDSGMNPKISDFGLAKLSSSDDTEGNTKRVVGTYGYMAPEYASEGLFSIKSDVFSFGVLVLEIIAGKKNSGFHLHGDFLNLLGYAWQSWKEKRWLQLVDASVVTDCCTLAIMRCVNIALLCVQENAADRPTTSDVVAMLSSESMSLPEPKHPAYFHVRVTKEEASAGAEPCSINDVTMTTPRGR